MPAPKDEKDMEETGSTMIADVSAGTGEASAAEVVKALEAQVLQARVTFLGISLIASISSAALGVIVWKQTNSLTIEVDDISSWSDVTSIFLNIAIEKMKVWLSTRRRVLIADFVGGFISLAMLMAVAVFGLVNALKRSEQDHKQNNDLVKPEYMLMYNSICLGLDFVALAAYVGLRERMEPPQMSPDDKLNVISGLVHMVVDLARGLSVTGTTIYMFYVANRTDESPWQKLSEKIHGDVFGSFLVCTCILICVVILMWTSVRTLYQLMADEKKDVEAGLSSDGERGPYTAGSKLGRVRRDSRDYGTMSDA